MSFNLSATIFMEETISKSIVLGIILSFGVLITGAFSAEYTVGVEAINYAPFYSDEGGDYSGFARDLLDLFAERQGCRFVYKPLPVKRLFSSLLNKSVDFKFPDNPDWQMTMKKRLFTASRSSGPGKASWCCRRTRAEASIR